jgi:ankyrin repeat protein
MEAVEFLLQNGADPNTKSNNNFTLLMYCAQYGSLRLVKMVVHYGASVNDKDLSGYTALDYAIENNNLQIVKFLVENGAHIHDQSYMLALESGHKTIVNFFDCLDPNKEVFLKKERYCANI